MKILPLATVPVEPILLPTERRAMADATAAAIAAGVAPPKIPEPEQFSYAENLFLILRADHQANGGAPDQVILVSRLEKMLLDAIEAKRTELRLEDADWQHIRSAVDRLRTYRGSGSHWVAFFDAIRNPETFDPNTTAPAQET